MADLRAACELDRVFAIELARTGTAEFSTVSNAAERGWLIAKEPARRVPSHPRTS
jgi:hypothetical protein